MKDLFPGKRQALMLSAFIIPSFIYWTSGLHKEGLIFLAISLIIYHLYFGWKEKRYSVKRWLSILSGLAILLVLRKFLMVLVVPAVLAWLLASRWPKYGLFIFASVYFFFGIVFFNAGILTQDLIFPRQLSTNN